MSLAELQSIKFKRAAGHLEFDDDQRRFSDRLAQLVKHKPVLGEPE